MRSEHCTISQTFSSHQFSSQYFCVSTLVQKFRTHVTLGVILCVTCETCCLNGILFWRWFEDLTEKEPCTPCFCPIFVYLSTKIQNPHYFKRHFMRDLWDLLFEWNPFLEMIWRFKRKRNPALRVFAPGMGRFFFRSCCCLYSSSTNFEFLHKDLDWLGHFLKKKHNNISPFKKGHTFKKNSRIIFL